MQESNNQILTGKIKTFNGRFGFITSELGETFFHKSGLKHDFSPKKNDEVEFQTEPSKQKVNMFNACKIVLIKRGEKEERQTVDEKYLLGTVKWFDSKKGSGYISAGNTDYFIHVSNLLATTYISEKDVVIFSKKFHNGKLSATNCQPFVDGLNNCSVESQFEFLLKYLLTLKRIDSSNYDRIKSIGQSDKIKKTVKDAFIKSAFKKADDGYKYKMLFEDNLIDIQNEPPESQIELLQKYLLALGSIYYRNYDRIKSIAKSAKIKKTAKIAFLKSAFEKADDGYKYKMLFEDNLIDIQNETSESQLELFQKYLLALGGIGKWNYDRIKSTAQSAKIKETVKDAFLKSAFEKGDAESKYKMLIEENMIDIQNETTESQIELLQKYLLALGGIGKWNYDRIKSIAQSDKIEKTVKEAFLKSAFEKADAEYQYQMLFEENMIDIQNETPESQIELLQKYLLALGSISYNNYYRIKSIAQSDKIEKTVKDTFLKSVFEKTGAVFQCNMLIDGLTILSEESQIELLQKYLLSLGSINKYNYDQIKYIAKSNRIEKTVKDAFLKSAFEKADPEYKYKMLFEDNLIDIQIETPESQIELLQKYLLSLGSINYSNYDRIESIAKSDNIEKAVKDAFLKSVFEKTGAVFQCNMLIDGLIILSEESQIELLQKYSLALGRLNYTSDYVLIKSIAQSAKIEKTVKDTFLKAAFEKAYSEYKYKMLFEDNLIDIQNEPPESQIELLQKYLLALGRIGICDYERIKSIAQSAKIKKTVIDTFLKSAFEKADAEEQYKMLINNYLVKDLFFRVTFLLNTTQSGRMTFKTGVYAGKTYFEVLEKDIEYLYNYKSTTCSDFKIFYNIERVYGSSGESINKQYNLPSKYEPWKKFWISILEDINRAIENQEIFTDNNTEDFFKKIAQINEARELYDIFGIEFNENAFKKAISKSIEQFDFNFIANIKNHKLLASLKKGNSEVYNSFFEQNYPKISKIDRLYLWLNNLNPYYNYLELVQSAWQLSKDERKLLNKRIKEHAKDERLQKFYDQIPVAELIEITETTKTYKCKWRNLYYKKGSIQVFFDKTSSSEDFIWEPSREEWNLLTQEYFNNRRIDDIIVTVNNSNSIASITGLEDIEVKILIAEIRKNGTADRKTSISSNQISKIIHNVSARNQCINFLARQNSNYKVLDVQELVNDDYGSLRRDISFIFPIPDDKGKVYLIWESAEFEKSKATHIFKCSSDELEDMELKIKDFIEGNLRTRSRLNSVEPVDLKVKIELQYFCRINHDNFEYQVWENRMREVLPFLK